MRRHFCLRNKMYLLQILVDILLDFLFETFKIVKRNNPRSASALACFPFAVGGNTSFLELVGKELGAALCKPRDILTRHIGADIALELEQN